MRYNVSFTPSNANREKSAIIDIRCGMSGYTIARNPPSGYYFQCTITIATEFMAFLREVAAEGTIQFLDELLTGFEPNTQSGYDCFITRMEDLVKYVPVFINLLNALNLKPLSGAPAKEQLIIDLTSYLEQIQRDAPAMIAEERRRQPIRRAREQSVLTIDTNSSMPKSRAALITSGLLLLSFIFVTIMLVMLAGPMGLLGSFAISTKAALITAAIMAIAASVSGIFSGIFMARNCCPLPTNDYQRAATDDISDTLERDPETRGRPRMQLGTLASAAPPLTAREQLLGRRDPPATAPAPDARVLLLGSSAGRRNPVGAFRHEYPKLSDLLEAPTFTGFPNAKAAAATAGVDQTDQSPPAAEGDRQPSPPASGSSLT